jgi:hypothetical protein
MKRTVLYKSVDPYYPDQTHVFIGSDEEEIDRQQYEFEQFLGREHPAGIMFIYKAHRIAEKSTDYQ